MIASLNPLCLSIQFVVGTKNDSGSIQNKKKRSTRRNDYTRNIKIYVIWS